LHFYNDIKPFFNQNDKICNEFTIFLYELIEIIESSNTNKRKLSTDNIIITNKINGDNTLENINTLENNKKRKTSDELIINVNNINNYNNQNKIRYMNQQSPYYNQQPF
jgi:hypothetical protein